MMPERTPRALTRDALQGLARHIVKESQQRLTQEMAMTDHIIFSAEPHMLDDDDVHQLKAKREFSIVMSHIGPALMEVLLENRAPVIPMTQVQRAVDRAIEDSYRYIAECRGHGHEEDADFVRYRSEVVAGWKESLDQKMLDFAAQHPPPRHPK